MSEPKSKSSKLSVVGRTSPELCRSDVVRLLEEMLEEAKRGEFIGVAIAAVTADQSSRTRWSRCDNTILLDGAVMRLHHRLQQTFGD